jgi:heme/copper-type cytochrome/quinol oxidase subunit 1
MNLKLTVNVLRAIIVLSLLGLAVQTYDFITQLSSADMSIQALPYLFETWFFGDAYVYPAWYPLILMVLAIIGLRFGETRSTVASIVPGSVS